MANITFDTSAWDKNIAKLLKQVRAGSIEAVRLCATELLRLSQLEVPFRIGQLKDSGLSEPDPEDSEGYVVGYNKVYAARLHEHPEYNFKNGRKGKYLEDPIKMNFDVFKALQVKAYTEAMTP